MAAAAIVAVLALLAVPAPAQAANPYSPQGVCGSGYSVIDSAPISTSKLWATVYLLYNSGNGNNCVVTIKQADIGTATYTEAKLQIEGSSTVYRDGGSYSYYAGPVRRYAAGKCVRWGGVASDRAGQSFSIWSGWEHCG
ncbi:spore-associated protein [Micromonospora deserti]|uniref:spore-associated protein n=1 Tax=Micromonospora deserti TaxID=2070366 RepID=UPI0018F280B3|nr:spore-associated protein [Micromonospora deserti]